MDGVVFRLGKNRFWYVQADGPFETWLIAHSGGFDITISDPHSRVLQIQGPASLDIMHAASNGAIDGTMKFYRSGYFDIGGQTLYVSRTGFTNELGFEIYCDGAATDHLALWDYLTACGEPHGMEFSSTRAMTIRRIEGGILGNLTDIDKTMTPFEAGLTPFIDMDKGDFVGRDALESKDTRSCLFGLTCTTETPAAGSAVLDGDTQVGRITAGVPSPTLGLGIGYVLFNAPGDWVGRALSLRLPNGTVHNSQIVDVPFFDREKKSYGASIAEFPYGLEINWMTQCTAIRSKRFFEPRTRDFRFPLPMIRVVWPRSAILRMPEGGALKRQGRSGKHLEPGGCNGSRTTG